MGEPIPNWHIYSSEYNVKQGQRKRESQRRRRIASKLCFLDTAATSLPNQDLHSGTLGDMSGTCLDGGLQTITTAEKGRNSLL